MLKYKFKHLNVRFDGGTEFYEKDIVDKIEPCFNEINLQFKKLSQDEIDSLIRKYRIKKICKNINKKKIN